MNNYGRIRGFTVLMVVMQNLIWILLIVAVIAFSLASDAFLTSFNVINIFWQSAPLGLLVIGQAFTLITGNFDFSSESTMALTTLIAAQLMVSSASGGLDLMVFPVFSIVVMLLLGSAIGLTNGLLISYLKMNSFIVTLGMLMLLRGIVYAVSSGNSVSNLPQMFTWLGGGTLFTFTVGLKTLGIPVAAIFLIVAFVVAHTVASYRRFGREVYTVGGNRAAAETAGINSRKVILKVYLISGLCAALAGWLLAGRLDSVTPRMGTGMIFVVQAAAVVGGISLFGGRGTFIGAFGGVLLWSILDSGLNILQVSPFWIEVARGGLLLFAVFIDAIRVRFMHWLSHRQALAQSTIGLEVE